MGKNGKFTPEWYLEHYAINLNQNLNVQDTIVIGRETEIKNLIYSLSRKVKNNPVLVGKAGVGKTAIVEGLVKQIINKQVPPFMLNKIVYSLELSNMTNVGQDGDLIYRLGQIVKALSNDRNKIIFIDEIHTIANTGAKKGALDAGNILKPALSRGDIQLIGATTLDEYHKYLATDKALERRFQTILVKEPTPDEAVTIIGGLKPSFEKFHHVKISKSASVASVKLSTRYDPEHQLPDKAIDLLDEASVRAKYKQEEKVTEATVAQVVQDKTGIPITTILKSKSQKVLHLEDYLNKRIKEQQVLVRRLQLKR